MSTATTRAERRAKLAAAGAIPSDDTSGYAVLDVTTYQPTVPDHVRDIAYISGLIVTGVVAITVPTISAIVPDIAGTAAQIGTAILSGVGLIVSGLGVVYRPGAQRY